MIETSRPVPGVLEVALRRGSRRNALTLDGFTALARTWAEVEADDTVRVVLLTGDGVDFCSGGDLAGLDSAIRSAGGEAWRAIDAAVLRGVVRTRPIVCAVEGICYGAGMELAGATDVRVCSTSARFALPETARGVIASGGSLSRLARQIPSSIAMQLLLTGRPMDADAMLACGFVSAVVPVGTARSAALDIAHDIAANSPHAVRLTTRVATAGALRDLDGALALETEASREAMTHPDAREGAAAFGEKRDPSWRLPG